MYSKPKCSSFDELTILRDKIKDKAIKEFDGLVSALGINTSQNEEWSNDYYRLLKECKKLSKSIKRLKVWKWILLIPLIFPFFIMNSSQKKKEPILEEKSKKLDEARNNLQKQLAEFRSCLSYDLAFNKIISSSWGDVKLDLYMDEDSGANWNHDYLQYMPSSSCATSLVSGVMFDHPFALMNRKDQIWVPHVYTGSVPVTHTRTNKDGGVDMYTEMVVASVTLPEPVWSYTPYFLYRTSKPMDLSFCNDLSKHKFKKRENKFEQHPMDNQEFDKLFRASRNDEKDYRVVFTPLAQEGFVELFKKRKYSIEKVKEVTSISTSMPLIDNDLSDDVNYNLQEWRNKFVDWIDRLVSSIGVFSLPIANLPVYHQMPYKEHSGKELSILQYQNLTEWVINQFNLWDEFETDAIFSCDNYRTIKSSNKLFNCVQMNCKYFHPQHKVEMVPRPSQDGTVIVPVNVIEYLSRDQELFIYTYDIGIKDKEIIADSYAIHCGQFITWSWTPIDPESLIETLNKIYK